MELVVKNTNPKTNVLFYTSRVQKLLLLDEHFVFVDKLSPFSAYLTYYETDSSLSANLT
jgi:hypothetical protein